LIFGRFFFWLERQALLALSIIFLLADVRDRRLVLEQISAPLLYVPMGSVFGSGWAFQDIFRRLLLRLW